MADSARAGGPPEVTDGTTQEPCADCAWMRTVGASRFAIWRYHRYHRRLPQLRLCADGTAVHDFKGEPACPSCGWRPVLGASS